MNAVAERAAPRYFRNDVLKLVVSGQRFISSCGAAGAELVRAGRSHPQWLLVKPRAHAGIFARNIKRACRPALPRRNGGPCVYLKRSSGTRKRKIAGALSVRTRADWRSGRRNCCSADGDAVQSRDSRLRSVQCRWRDKAPVGACTAGISRRGPSYLRRAGRECGPPLLQSHGDRWYALYYRAPGHFGRVLGSMNSPPK